MMNLYLLTNSTNNGYDTFDSCIVTAESATEAQGIHPNQGSSDRVDYNPWEYNDVWCNKEDVTVTLIGTPNPDRKKGVVLASFNAG